MARTPRLPGGTGQTMGRAGEEVHTIYEAGRRRGSDALAALAGRRPVTISVAGATFAGLLAGTAAVIAGAVFVRQLPGRARTRPGSPL